MGKWYRVSVRVRVRKRARAREHSSSFLFFFFLPKFAYVVTICNLEFSSFEFCYKRRAIYRHTLLLLDVHIRSVCLTCAFETVGPCMCNEV